MGYYLDKEVKWKRGKCACCKVPKLAVFKTHGELSVHYPLLCSSCYRRIAKPRPQEPTSRVCQSCGEPRRSFYTNKGKIVCGKCYAFSRYIRRGQRRA
jgi:hypothetical protein